MEKRIDHVRDVLRRQAGNGLNFIHKSLEGEVYAQFAERLFQSGNELFDGERVARCGEQPVDDLFHVFLALACNAVQRRADGVFHVRVQESDHAVIDRNEIEFCGKLFAAVLCGRRLAAVHRAGARHLFICMRRDALLPPSGKRLPRIGIVGILHIVIKGQNPLIGRIRLPGIVVAADIIDPSARDGKPLSALRHKFDAERRHDLIIPVFIQIH